MSLVHGLRTTNQYLEESPNYKSMFKTITSFCLFGLAFTSLAQTFDTTGIGSWANRYNSYDTWMIGAFDAYRDAGNPADFGWGSYDLSTHIIAGDSIYILKTVDGDFIAISIDQLASGIWDITYSNLDGTGRVTKTFDRAPYSTKNFFYYSIDSETLKDLEPASDSWDIKFTKYPIVFPGFGQYPVAGVLHNDGVQVSKVETDAGQTASINDTMNFPMSPGISTIGYDWKDAFAGVVYDTLTYFVKDQIGNLNTLQFTAYGGSANGNIAFTVNGVADSVSLNTGNVEHVFYSLQNRNAVSTNTDNAWDIAIFAGSSFDALPVRINEVYGAELYTYPLADINHWNSIGLVETDFQLLSVYPNPAKTELNLVLNNGIGANAQVQLLSTTGIVVRSMNIDDHQGFNEQKFNVEGLAPGTYFLQLKGAGFGASVAVLIQP